MAIPSTSSKQKLCAVSIPKRVSEVLWHKQSSNGKIGLNSIVSIPKRVSEVLWPKRRDDT